MTKFEDIIGKELPFKVGDKVREYYQSVDGVLTYMNSVIKWISLETHQPSYHKYPIITFHTAPLREGMDKRNYGYRDGNSVEFDSMEDMCPIVINGIKYNRMQLMSEPPYKGAV